MNILCDFHHSDLWWSSHLIFEVGLGHKLFRPRGMEWFERGYYYNVAPDVARQYLIHSFFGIEDARFYPDVHLPLLEGVDARTMRMSTDHISGCKHYPLMRTITLEEFADAEIDVIMTTLSNNQEPWARLRKDLKPKAKLLREEGNVNGWATLHPDYPNVMTSDFKTFQKCSASNKVLYHQKIDTERVFHYREPSHFDRITCFMPGFRGVPELVKFAESHDFGGMEFYDYGHLSKRGFLAPKAKFAEEVARAAFIWHVKPGGDGFGHVIHSSLAMGRPIITVAEDYYESQVWPLLLDGKTCILIGKDPVENSKKIQSFQNPEQIVLMSRAARDRFAGVVDYKWESDMIRRFLERLV